MRGLHERRADISCGNRGGVLRLGRRIRVHKWYAMGSDDDGSYQYRFATCQDRRDVRNGADTAADSARPTATLRGVT